MRAPSLFAALAGLALLGAGSLAAGQAPPPPVLLAGKPFPAKSDYGARLPAPRRTLYVAAGGRRGGRGTQGKPWNDLQVALRALRPGDRLVVGSGAYPGAFRIDESCKDGEATLPIQVVGEGNPVLGPGAAAPVLTIARAFWQIQAITVAAGPKESSSILLAGMLAHDLLLDRVHLNGGRGPGIDIGTGVRNVTVSNSSIHHLQGGGPTQSHGIAVDSRVVELRILGNDIHHNEGSGVFVAGPRGKGKGMKSFIESLTIAGNTIHGNGMHGVKIRGGSRAVRITDNRFWNQRPSRNSRGAAILLYPNVRDSFIEGNHVADSSIGIHLGTTEPGTGVANPGPRNIAITRNYVECRSVFQSVGLSMNSGQQVRVQNNVIDGCTRGLELMAQPPGEGFSIANNLILSASDLAFSVSSETPVEYFGHNVFGYTDRRPQAQITGDRRDLSALVSRHRMEESRAEKGIRLVGRDLARVEGGTLVDRGKRLGPAKFRGKAPDVGIADQ